LSAIKRRRDIPPLPLRQERRGDFRLKRGEAAVYRSRFASHGEQT
jgi:hypothetical protein